MLTMDNWLRQKKRIEELRKQADKVEAELQVAMEELRDKDKVKTIKQAKVRYDKKIKEEIRLYKEWVKLYKSFKAKHGKKL